MEADAFPGYLISIIIIFVLPVSVLLAGLWGRAPKRALAASTIIIGLLGSAWSCVLNFEKWWSFGDRFLLGVDIVPHLPLEEFLFYPLGGALAILIYLRFRCIHGRCREVRPALFWCFLVLGTMPFGLLAFMRWDHGPYYICSQLILFNSICCMVLAPWASRSIDLRALAAPITILAVVGYIWNCCGIHYGWWAYHAVLGIHLPGMPIDDVNFFLFAPTAAVSIYHCVCRALGVEALRSRELLPVSPRAQSGSVSGRSRSQKAAAPTPLADQRHPCVRSPQPPAWNPYLK